MGHTHKDNDGYFSYLSKKLKNKNTYVLADLMKSFMDSQQLMLVSELIQEVPNYKSYLARFL